MNTKPLQNWPPEVQTGHGWWATILQIAMATVASGAIAYVATNPQQLARTAAAVVAPAQETEPPPTVAPRPAIPSQPVTFKNPFDRTEVFEFPPGTTETEARQAVAQVLMERARERRNAWFRPKHSSNHPSTLARVSDPDDESGRRACSSYSSC